MEVELTAEPKGTARHLHIIYNAHGRRRSEMQRSVKPWRVVQESYNENCFEIIQPDSKKQKRLPGAKGQAIPTILLGE